MKPMAAPAQQDQRSAGAPFKSLAGGLKWGAVNAVSLIVSKILRGAVIPKILDPAAYGLFTSISIFLRYLQFSDFGTSAYFLKELPHCHFNKGEQDRQALVDTAFTLVALSCVLVAFYLGGAALLYDGKPTYFYTYALLLLIPITILAKLKDFFINYSVAIQDYGNSSRFSIANNYISIVFTIVGVYLFGALGGIGGMLATEIILLLYVYRATPLDVCFVRSLKIFSPWRSIIKQFTVSITDVVAATVDQIFILQVFDARSLGFYALGLSFSWVLESISEIFNTTSYPKLMAIARADKGSAVELVDMTILCFLLASILLLPAAVVAIELIVSYYFVAYEAGLSVYSTMLILGMLRGAAAIIRRGYIALDKEKLYITLTAATTTAYSALLTASLFLKFSFHLTVSAIVVMNIATFGVSYALLGSEKSKLFFENVLIVLAAAALLLSYQYVIGNDGGAAFAFDRRLLFLVGIFTANAAYVYRSRGVFNRYMS
jgi:O-antigen/teichoic acid export membrane protein